MSPLLFYAIIYNEFYLDNLTMNNIHYLLLTENKGTLPNIFCNKFALRRKKCISESVNVAMFIAEYLEIYVAEHNTKI